MRKFVFRMMIILSIVFLTACSGVPLRLEKTANREMLLFLAKNTNITEDNLYLEPLLIDQLQVTEDKWCLTYEIGHLLSFSTLWEKQEQAWVQTEIKPYTENCNWAR